MISIHEAQKMTVRVDTMICSGCETCVSVCPQVFQMREGVAVPRMAPVPSLLAEGAREAAIACPVDAIAVMP